MIESNDFQLILLPLLLAFISSLVIFTIASRVYRSDARSAKRWLTSGSFAMGSIIWALHIGGLQGLLDRPPSGFAWGWLLFSWLAAITVSWLALLIASKPKLTPRLLITGGGLIGLGISIMYYSSLYATGMPVAGVSFTLFTLIAIAASMVGLMLLFWLRAQHAENSLLPKILAASLISAAIGCMYYSGLAASALLPDSAGNGFATANSALYGLSITIFLSGLILIILSMATLRAKPGPGKMPASLSIRDANQELSRMAMIDSLTQLPNRRFFQQHLEVGISRAARMENFLALAYIDLDGFKPINDAHGHHIGDEVLQAVAGRLNGAVRGCDVVARIGGDEFVVLIEDINSDQDIILIVERIVQSLRDVFLVNGREIYLSASVGIAVYPRDAGIDRLMICADAAMYEAKKSGKNQFRFFDPGIEMTSNRLHEMQHELQQALNKNEFELHFQPKLDARNGEVTGIEALLRWRHPVKGLIPPAEFAAILDQLGPTNQIAEWVIENSCQVLDLLRSKGFITQISSNFSAQQLLNPQLIKTLQKALERHDLPPSALMAEITESCTALNPAQFEKQLNALKAAGIAISLDDFGTGASSIACLRKLGASELKLHGDLISEIGNNPQTVQIVEAVIKLAHALGLSVVAEGVETEDQRRILTGLDCDQLQGFLLARPVARQDVPALAQSLVS